MAMVSVVNWQPTGGLMVQPDRLGPKVDSHLTLCCIHRVNQGGAPRTERQSARMSKITNDGLTRSVTGCILAVPV